MCRICILKLFIVIYKFWFVVTQGTFINEIDELNCDFSIRSNFCQWSPIALPPENRNHWKITNTTTTILNINNKNGVTPFFDDDHNNALQPFIYAQFKRRSGSASLISNGILCQNEPFNITIETYVTNETKLFICYRILTLPSKFITCNEIKIEKYNEWKNLTIKNIYQSKPYQIIFRAFGSNKHNIIAIKNLKIIGGSLCEKKKQQNRRKRRNSEQIKVITYEDWQKIRKGNEPPPQVHPKILLIVSEQVETTTTSSTTTTPITTTTSEVTTTTTTLKSTIKKCTNDFCTEKESSEEEVTEKAESKDDEIDEREKTTKSPSLDAPQNIPSLGQWVQLLKNVAPIIPIIPSLINSLKYSESPQPISSTATLNNQFSGNPDMSFRSEEKVFSWKPGETRRAPTPIVPVPVAPINQQNLHTNAFGISTNPLDISKVTPDTALMPGTLSKQDINLSSLTVNELKTLETIHKKIFPLARHTKPNLTRGESRRKTEPRRKINDRIINYTEPPKTTVPTTTIQSPPLVVVFEKPKQQINDMRASVSQNLKYLTPQMLEELNMVSNLPDLEMLTEGLDLSLLNKPGGFAILKQQFMERLIKRLPFKEDDTDLLQRVRYHRT